MKKLVIVIALLLSAWPVLAGPTYTYGPMPTKYQNLPKYPLAGADASREQPLFAAAGGALPLQCDLRYQMTNHQADGELGEGWSHSYEIYLHRNSDATMVMTGGVEKHFFFADGGEGGGYKPRIGDPSTLTRNGDGTWTVTLLSGLKYQFGADLKLTAISDRNGKTIQIDTAIPNQKIVTDPSGRQAIIHYSANKIDWIRDPAQKQYDFTYNAKTGMLESVTFPPPDATKPKLRPRWEYRYTAAELLLEYVKDPQGRITKYGYVDGRVKRKVEPPGVVDMNGAESPDVAQHSTIWVYEFARDAPDSRAVTRIEKDGKSWVYHYANGAIASVEPPNGYKTQHLFYLDVPTMDLRYGLPKEDAYPMDPTTLYVIAYIAYDANSKPTEIKFYPRTLNFDSNGNLLSTSDGALERHLLLTYDKNGRIITKADQVSGVTITTEYDANGKKKETMTSAVPKTIGPVGL